MKVSGPGRSYRSDVAKRLAALDLGEPFDCRLAVRAIAYPPDNRRRDLDNLGKALLDSLKPRDGLPGAIVDDGLIDWLQIERGPVIPGGRIALAIEDESNCQRCPTCRQRVL